MKMKPKFLILMLLIFSFSISYGANGNEEFEKGNNYINQKKYNEAEKYFLEALKKGNPNAYNALGYLYSVQGKFQKAEYYLLKDLENTKDEKLKERMKINLAYIYIKQNKEKEAEKLLRTIKNNDITIFKMLANFYYDNQNYEKAEEFFKKALAKGDNVSINNIVVISIKRRNVTDEIKNLIKKEYENGNVYAYGYYGTEKIKDGSLEEGERICKLGIQKGDPSSYLCMSVFYEQKGNKTKSKELFEKYKLEMSKLEDKLEKK